MAYILLENEDKAISIIQNAIAGNPAWKENLPAFYCLSDHPEIKQLISVDSFSLKDWNNAINFMTEINKYKESIDLALKILQKFPSSSFTCYLLGKAYKGRGNIKMAKAYLKKALVYDEKNPQAKNLLDTLDK
ncbi:MAG: hypothetical protein ABI675_25600 [Chitinophagaceae bacterium]